MSWRARNGSDPCVAHQASSCARGMSSRLTRAAASAIIAVASVPCMGMLCCRASGALTDLRSVEEESNLASSRLGRVRTMYHIGFDALRQISADRAGGRLGRIRRAHDLAMPGHRVLALQHLRDHGPGAHVSPQGCVKGPLAMHRVEELCLFDREPQHAGRDNAQALALIAPIHLADQIALYAVGLDDGQGAL